MSIPPFFRTVLPVCKKEPFSISQVAKKDGEKKENQAGATSAFGAL
jgi:hypothetical protein